MRAVAGLLALLCFASAFAADPLPALHAEGRNVTVSGVSAGGYMAVQFHVAHSASVSGVGVIAGGPYYCAQGNVFTAYYNCMTPGGWTPLPRAELLKLQADAFANARRIDPTANLARARAWLFSGTNDHIVYPEVVAALRDFYAGYKAQVLLVSDRPAGHGMVTQTKGEACGATRAPFIVSCKYDAAGEMLRFLMGKLLPAAAKESGELMPFDQNAYAGADAHAIAMDDVGFVYVPQACKSQRCAIHVAFHGCRQGRAEIGERFAREAGYNAWADSNALIVLYPQVVKRYSPLVFNPRGCWDWWGYTGADYATSQGAQIRAVKAMVEALGR
ncbi:MAG TPA: PHB depolymerase family esterase [Burkholderiales bacterium]